MASEQENQRVVVTTRPIVPPYAQQGIIKTDNPRLYARPFHIDDLPALHELRTQIEVMQWTSTGKVDIDLDATRTWMGRFMNLEHDIETTVDGDLAQQKLQTASSSPTSFNFVIVYDSSPTPAASSNGDHDVPSTQVIGAGGCHSFGPEPEVGYMIRKEHWGRGLATSFLRAFLAAWWALDREVARLPLTPALHDTLTRKRGFTVPAAGDVALDEYVQALIAAHNTGSRRVLEKCGFRHVWDEEVEERGERVTLADYVLFRP